MPFICGGGMPAICSVLVCLVFVVFSYARHICGADVSCRYIRGVGMPGIQGF